MFCYYWWFCYRFYYYNSNFQLYFYVINCFEFFNIILMKLQWIFFEDRNVKMTIVIYLGKVSYDKRPNLVVFCLDAEKKVKCKL